MLKIKDKYDYRKELSDALKNGRHLQTKGQIGNPANPDSMVCFLGVAMRVYPDVLAARNAGKHRETLAFQLGVSKATIDSFVAKNDYGHTFPELAVLLENLP